MEEITTSPSKTKDSYPKQESFYAAIMDVVMGKKITKVEWGNEEEYGFMKDEILSIHRNGKDHGWLVSRADIEGEDFYAL